MRDPEQVFRLNLARLGGFRREGPVDEHALRERLQREERVVLVVTAERVCRQGWGEAPGAGHPRRRGRNSRLRR